MSEPRGVPPDVEAKLHQLERLVGDAKTVPLSASVMLNRAEIDGIVADLREALPDELTQARWVVKERDEILERAQIDADEILTDARAERDRLISQQEVTQGAAAAADRIVGDAREHARRIRLEAEDYVDAKLANFEVVLHKTLTAVERGRQKLRGGLDTDALETETLDHDHADALESLAAPPASRTRSDPGIDIPLDDDEEEPSRPRR
jgi:cell division septum initiation protein DivIVA